MSSWGRGGERSGVTGGSAGEWTGEPGLEVGVEAARRAAVCFCGWWYDTTTKMQSKKREREGDQKDGTVSFLE